MQRTLKQRLGDIVVQTAAECAGMVVYEEIPRVFICLDIPLTPSLIILSQLRPCVLGCTDMVCQSKNVYDH